MAYDTTDAELHRVRSEVRRFKEHVLVFVAVLAVLVLGQYHRGGLLVRTFLAVLDRAGLGCADRAAGYPAVRPRYRARLGRPHGQPCDGRPAQRTASPSAAEAAGVAPAPAKPPAASTHAGLAPVFGLGVPIRRRLGGGADRYPGPAASVVIVAEPHAAVLVGDVPPPPPTPPSGNEPLITPPPEPPKEPGWLQWELN